MLPRLTREKQKALELALDAGTDVPRELALAAYQEVIFREATTNRWAALLASSGNELLRKAGRALLAAVESPE